MAASAWFKGFDAGVTDAPPTLATVCKEYVADRKKAKGEATGHDADKRFERTVYSAEIGGTLVDRLRTLHYRGWLEGLDLERPLPIGR